jgi:hypothetical protein
MKTTQQLREWLCRELASVMGRYNLSENEAREHIRYSIEELPTVYADIASDEAPVVLRLIRDGAKT